MIDFLFVMIPRPTISTRTDTLFPYTTLVRSKVSLLGPYTVVRRRGDKLVAVPYSVEYAQWLEPAAKLLEQAAARTSNASLKKFLTLRAKAFRTDDYFESELAWMDLSGTPSERSEERSVGKESVSTGSTRWSQSHYKKNNNTDYTGIQTYTSIE